jgi:hypothetical protein
MATSPKGLGPEKDYAGDEGQQCIHKRPVLSSERVLQKNKTVTAKE